MSKDFRASQIETSKLIASGGISGTSLGLAIYSGSIASNRAGAVSDSTIFNDVGSDVFLFVSGSKSNSDFNRSQVSLFGGDVVISGTLYAERQVIEVDGVVDGDMIVTASLFVEPDANSSKSVAFRQADGTDIFVVNSSDPRVQITGSVAINGQIQQDNNQLILNANHEANINTSNTPLLIRSKNNAMMMSASLAGRNFVVSSHRDAGNSDIILNPKGNLVIRRHSGVNSTNDFGQAGQSTLVFSDVSNASLDDQTNLDGSPAGSGTKRAYIQKDASNNLNIVSSNDIKLQIDNTGQAKNILLQPKNIDGSNVIINDDGLTNPDFRVESNTLQGAILVDGADDTIVLGSNVTTFAGLPSNGKGNDVKIMLSGSIGSKGSSTRGTTLISGDAVVSGALDVNTVSITADGKLGIGTSNPSYKLEVGGNAAFGEYLYHRGNTATFIQFAEDSIGFTAGNEQLLTIAESGTDMVTVGDGGAVDFRVRTENDDYTLYVSGGADRVGIGTNSPVSVLHVKEAAPTLSIQRENNSNDSTVAFLGASGFTGAIMHLSSSNDLVFKTHDGTSPHEILRLGGHYAEDVRQVIFLSGSTMAPTAMQPKESTDINFFVSGAMGSKGTATRGTAVFGGDVAISGTLYGGSPLKVSGGMEVTGSLTLEQGSKIVFPVGSGLTGSLQEISAGNPYLLAGSNISITTASNGQVTITSTGVAAGAGGSNTQVLFNASGAQAGDANFTFNSSTDTLTVSNMSGSLTRLTDGKSFLVAGSGTTISSASNGQITISSTGTSFTAGNGIVLAGNEFSIANATNGGVFVDTNTISLNLANLAEADVAVGSDSIAIIDATDFSTKRETIADFITATAGSGLNAASGVLSIDDSIVATVSGSTFSGVTKHNQGLSGSLTQLTDGTSYLIEGSNITITSASNGAITIASANTDTTYTAGTGLDLTSTEFSVDVSDFMTNGANNRIVTATGTDAMNAEANLTFDGTDLSVSGKVKTTGLEYTDGDEAITVQDGGYIKYESGVTHSPAVKVNGDNNTSADQWIKIAEAEAAGTDGDTIITNLLVNICGNEGPTDNADDVYATFLVHAEFTAKSSSPFYYATGTKLYVDVFTNDQLGGFNPTTDIFISYEEDSTPVHALYIKSKEENKDVYVTHLGGTDTTGGTHSDPAMKILSGQNWETTGIDSFSLGGEYYGLWASKTLKDLVVTDNNSATLTLGSNGIIKDGNLRIQSTAGSKYIAGNSQVHQFFANDITQGIATFTSSGILVTGSMTIGVDADGSDRQLIFGHSTLKSTIGIDDSGDVFAINTDSTFDAGGVNDLEIDTSGNVTIGNGDLIVGNMTIESTGNEITTAGNMLFDTSNDITLDADGGNIYLKDAGTTNINITLAGSPGLYATGNLTIDTDSVLTLDGASGTSFKESGTQRMLIENASGDVAIGSHSPDYRLDVQDDTTTFVTEFTNANSTAGADMFQMVFSGQTDPDGWIIYVKDSGEDRIYGVKGDGDGTSTVYTTFTGFHDTAIENNSSMIPGMIVESTGIPWAKNTNLNYHNVLPYSRLTNSNGSKSVFGVLARDDQNKVYVGENKINNLNYGGVRPGSFPGLVKNYPMNPNHAHVSVMSLGEGAIWVTNIAGNIENGDLIESSVVTGYGRLQSDDIMRSKTVAKCTEDIDWANVTDTIQHEGVTYKKYLTACTFHCG